MSKSVTTSKNIFEKNNNFEKPFLDYLELESKENN